ncbi:major facilitator superfamily transport protein [Natronomonas moolapensis 8.8.11]|jgi:MFS family permease|uniref:Major facilitator superfamily transport protein n=1 Tax=Natronomonas moolapensis (strain DSM 18674 / CECT 7526 / JCM 14361 / 8.8.11) TaxID=268739 RepID=M1XQL6_NATM8|nr:MFS transporter [Natronomonas moolapensis]CCQ36398.1 major facilitator superfamily transport protein [Natronomonas moolapensis 8.8.11]
MTGRRQWFALALATVTRFTGAILMGTALAVIVEARASAFAAGLVGTAYYAGLMLWSPFWGAIADITGRRRAVLLLTGAGGVAAVVPLVAVDSVAVAIGSRGVYAAFLAGFAPVALSIASHHGGTDGRGRSIGIFNSARSGGSAVGYVAVGAALEYVAPVAIYWAVAAVTAVSTVALLLVADPTPTPEQSPSLGAVLAETRRRLLPAPDERGHLRRNGLAWLYVAVALRNVAVLGIMAVVAPYLIRVIGVAELAMGALLAFNHGSQVGFMYALGVVADRTGRKPLVVAGMGGSAAFALLVAGLTLVPPGVSRLVLGAATFVVLGASFSAMTIGGLAFISDVAPDGRESELMGIRETAKGLGGVVGPTVVGGVATLASYETAFAAASLLGVLATAIVAWGLVETYDTVSTPLTVDP